MANKAGCCFRAKLVKRSCYFNINFIAACFYCSPKLTAMLEDIAPAIRSSKKIKVLTAAPRSTEDKISFESNISFLPFINYLKKKSVGDDTRSRFYNYLIERFEA